MRSFSQWVLAVFASPLGIFVLAALDSTLFFNLPFGIDAVVIILAARSKTYAWIVPLVATAGSVVGAALTFWIGVKIGENGLDRFVPARRLEHVRDRVRNSGAIALAILDLIPPPFPFTPFVLAAGALEVRPALFFITLGACRILRFGLETLLATIYGRSILSWLDADLFNDIVFGFLVLGAVLTALSLDKLLRTSGRRRVLRVRA